MKGQGLQYLSNLAEWQGTGDFSLGPMQSIMKALGNPQDTIPSIHVAGTNGKGSVAAAIASILGAGGNRVGLTISPHLSRINERVLIDGLPASDELLDEFGVMLKRVAEKEGIELTFFEGITALAFLIFSELKLNWMVVETGLGGRLDATNVLSKPKAVVIVTIDLDHEEILGCTLAKIASEKAGIIKAGSMLVVGEIDTQPLEVILRAARERQVKGSFVFGEDYGVEDLANGFSRTYRLLTKSVPVFDFEPSLKGRHQAHNMAVAIQTCLALGSSREDCQLGVRNVFWPARLEEIQYQGKTWLLDCAHNVAGASRLAEYLRERGLLDISLGFGVLKDKNWKQIINILRPYVGMWSILRPESLRALDPVDVFQYLSGIGISAQIFDSDYERFMSTQLALCSKNHVVVTGSMYMVGRIRRLLSKEDQPIWKRYN